MKQKLILCLCAVSATGFLSACRTAERWRGSSDRVIAEPGFLEQFARTGRFRFGHPRSFTFTPDNETVLFLRGQADSPIEALYEYDLICHQERMVLTADQILKGAEETLTPEEIARRERMRLGARGIAFYQLSKDGTKILVPLAGSLYVVERDGGRVTQLVGEGGSALDPRFSPDGQFVACVREGDLYVIDVAANTQTRLTSGAGNGIEHGLAEFVAQEEMDRLQGYWWSPDSRFLAYQRTDTRAVEQFSIMDPAQPGAAPQQWPYPRPGKNNADVTLGVISITGGDTRWIAWDRTRYPYLATVRWAEDAPLTILVQNREQTEQVLYAVDATGGTVRKLLVERDPAWINLDQKFPAWLAGGREFLWASERNGYWNVEQRHIDREGEVLATYRYDGYKGILGVDTKRRLMVVSASADITQTHLGIQTLSADTGAAPGAGAGSETGKNRQGASRGDQPGFTRLTDAPGVHSAVFSSDHRRYVHMARTLDGAVTYVVRDEEGRELGRIASAAAALPFVPQIELLTVGPHRSHAVVIRPRNFVPRRRYPVIVSVYGGPHAQVVNASPTGYVLQQWMADHGFIVVSLDGRGTPNRGREWERIIKGNLIDIPLEDQIAGLKALAARYPEMDMTRAGIFGWSFGGYFSAMAVMRHPEMFRAGVAGAPVCDWLDYDTHYTERYMGMPDTNAAGYEASNVLTYCKDLRRPLLIVHGTADDNVYLTHALKMCDALFKAGNRFEFLPLIGQTHSPRGAEVTRHLYERIMRFFVENLK